MAVKYYAVKGENDSYIFDNWDKCKSFLEGKKGYKYKSFSSKEEAQAFNSGRDIYLEQIEKDLSQGYVVAYTDGSFEQNLNKYSFGVVVVDETKKEHCFCGYGNYEKFLSSRNVAGEVLGVITALEWAVSNGKSKIKIYHDYNGLSEWANGNWGTSSPIGEYYVNKINGKYRGVIDIKFEKVKGHSNNKYNELVDKLAKSSLFENKTLLILDAYSFVISDYDYFELVKDVTNQFKESEIFESDFYTTYDLLGERVTVKKVNNKILVYGSLNFIYCYIVSKICLNISSLDAKTVLKQAFRFNLTNKNDILNNNILLEISQCLVNFDSDNYAKFLFFVITYLNTKIKEILSKNQISYNKISELFDFDGTFTFKQNIEEKTAIEYYFNTYYKLRKNLTSKKIDKNEYQNIINEVIKNVGN